MGGRIACSLPLLLVVTGCMFTRNNTQQVVNGPVIPPPGAVIKKPEEGPKRKPKPETVVALAVLREQAGDKDKNTPEERNRYYDEARQIYQEALEIDAKHVEAVRGLARIYSKLGDHEKANVVLAKALEELPKELSLWHDLGMTRNRAKDYEGAAACFREALKLDPDNRGTMQLLGFTLARAGRIDESLPYLTKSMGKAGAHYNAGRMLAHLGRKEECLAQLRLAVQASPDHQQAREMLARLQHPTPPEGNVRQATGARPQVAVPPRQGTRPATLPSRTPGNRPQLDIVTLE